MIRFFFFFLECGNCDIAIYNKICIWFFRLHFWHRAPKNPLESLSDESDKRSVYCFVNDVTSGPPGDEGWLPRRSTTWLDGSGRGERLAAESIANSQGFNQSIMTMQYNLHKTWKDRIQSCQDWWTPPRGAVEACLQQQRRHEHTTLDPGPPVSSSKLFPISCSLPGNLVRKMFHSSTTSVKSPTPRRRWWVLSSGPSAILG